MFQIIFNALIITCLFSLTFSQDGDNFYEELLIKPLPSGHIYSHFEFTSTWSSAGISESVKNYSSFKLNHFDLFPRALGEIISHYHVRELHFSLTQGLWRHQKWGYPITEAPPGAQLWVWFTPHDNIDKTWRDLVNALSGLFCASLNFIDSTNTVSPELSYRPQGLAEQWYASNSSHMRYAALPREIVCTENLTPWKKLLPCDNKAGLAMLLHPAPLYSANYHSLALHLRPSCQDSSCHSSQLELIQSLSMVKDSVVSMKGRQDWSLRHLFSSPLLNVCPLASVSNVYVDVTGDENFTTFKLFPTPDAIEHFGEGNLRRALAVYDIGKAVADDPFNLQSHYENDHAYAFLSPPTLFTSRFIAGHGQESGVITVILTNTGNEPLKVLYLEVLPWYLRLFFHSSRDRYKHNLEYISKLVLARDREAGWMFEAVVRVPAKSSVELSLDFTRALLKWLEYPPDANHGFYLPAATVSVMLPSTANVTSNNWRRYTLRERLILQDIPSFVRLYTETLIVSLPTPDFSMPYNVICLACTVVALAFGPIHNITTKRLMLQKVEASQSRLVRLKNFLKKMLRLGGGKQMEPMEEKEVKEVSLEEENVKEKENVSGGEWKEQLSGESKECGTFVKSVEVTNEIPEEVPDERPKVFPTRRHLQRLEN